ncbi:Ig-like domain-containing protein [Mycobacterium sp.]|uniref:Ig-like domain-containing protein n=1 Tax=Mycobacterium sp. TaxID=1785 RepID=UPI002DB1A8FD|nr:Ig-like domain-containing protein [Mycobacterium sp.]
MGAALLGFSLMGPQVGVAAADSTGESSTSSSSAGSDASDASGASKPSEPSEASDSTQGAASSKDDDADVDDDAGVDADAAEDAEDSDDGDVGADAGGTDESDSESSEAGADSESEGTDDAVHAEEQVANDSADVVVDEQPYTEADVTQSPDTSAATKTAQSASLATAPVAAEPYSSPTAATAQVSLLAPSAPQATWQQFVAQAISDWTAATQSWIESLPVDDSLKVHLEGAFWAVRRTFFNQAPTVAPIQISGQITGPVTGSVGAVDPDGDRLIYLLTRGPAEGSVQLNEDGTYTYTPASNFDGVDSFDVVAVDVGLHINVFDLFRPLGVNANSLINQGAIKFAFTYTNGAQYWTDERREALRQAANDVLVYFMVTAPVVLTYDVAAEEDVNKDTLASAGSDFVSEDPGFWRTVVQNKLLSGVDSNGAAADGEITWNFGHAWGLGDTIGSGEYDFASTAIHELLHSFGFLSAVDKPGANTGRNWAVLDSFVVVAGGAKPINPEFIWDTDYDSLLTGGAGSVFFGGANAVAAYGGMVPLFTPNPWANGSSMSHLDDFTFTGANQKIMNARTDTGLGIRVLSPVELGILRDIGYQVVVPQSPAATLALVV